MGMPWSDTAMKGEALCGSALVAAALTLAPAHAGPNDTWRVLKPGLAVEQVMALYPAAEEGTHARLASHASEELHLASLELAGHVFAADFYFRSGGLEEVRMRLGGALGTNELKALGIFDDVVAKLKGALGRPRGCQIARNISTFEGCEWADDKTRTDVLFLSVGDETFLFDVDWRAAH